MTPWGHLYWRGQALKQLKLRLPDELHARLVDMAERGSLSLNSTIIVAVMHWLDEAPVFEKALAQGWIAQYPTQNVGPEDFSVEQLRVQLREKILHAEAAIRHADEAFKHARMVDEIEKDPISEKSST
jgi:hypothetical protein